MMCFMYFRKLYILMKQAPSMSGEQAQMYRILQQKKVMVVDGLLGVLSHKNRSNMDDSINATEILIELVDRRSGAQLIQFTGHGPEDGARDFH